MPKPRIMFDNDARHPLIYMYEPPIRKEEYQSAVDELVGTPVEALTFSLGDTQSLLHDTRVGGTWGADIEKWPHLIWKRALQNSRVLIAEGNDPLRVICDRAHETGILIYPSLFVQQGGRERFIESWADGEQGAEFVHAGGGGFRPTELKPLHIGAGGGLAPDDPATYWLRLQAQGGQGRAHRSHRGDAGELRRGRLRAAPELHSALFPPPRSTRGARP